MGLINIIHYKLNIYKKLIDYPKFHIVIFGTVIELNCQHLKMLKRSEGLTMHEVCECEHALAATSVVD